MLEQLEPQEVFYWFEQICQIPHGSGNTKAISDFIVNFARERRLAYRQDQWNNVILQKPASPGYEHAPAVILQGHLDMVCEKDHDTVIDFEKEGLRLAVDGDWVYARGTTLGGDDGIAIAYGLALLASDHIAHPALEVVFTTDEETGMDGAIHIDLSGLAGRRLLNLDSEEEGHILCGCAGGLRCDCTFSADRKKVEKDLLSISIEGLTGGHSGTEINKNRANSNQLMGRLLYRLSGKAPFDLAVLEGGSKDNAIPVKTSAVLAAAPQDCETLLSACRETESIFRNEYGVSDPGIRIVTERRACRPGEETAVVPGERAGRIYRFLTAAPWGVQDMSADIEGLVETSLNLGIMKLDAYGFTAKFSLRSSVASKKEALTEKLRVLTEAFGGSFQTNSDYPGWEYKRDSAFRRLLEDTYRSLYGREPVTEVIHAGLECGILLEKIPGLDCVSIGPDIIDIHTPRERLSVSSVARVWKYLLEILKNCREEGADYGKEDNIRCQ